jgi:HK97 family phage prohead protease
MSESRYPIGIIGGGAWGTALAAVMAQIHDDVLLWAREEVVVRSVNGGKPFTERVARGAFDQSLRGNISLLVGHDRRELLANTKSQRLKLASDERGLAFDVQLPDTQRAKDVYALVDSGVLSEMSFGFVVRSDAWKGSERTLTQVDLREVSIVESGAYPQTSAEARTYSPALARLRLRLRALT